jgi:predicted nucleotidyltransferase
MNNVAVYKAIRQTVQSHIPGSRILLFGSRARGSHDRNSDYDLLIITQITFTLREKIDLSTRLDRAIVDNIKIPVDLLINSEEEVRQKQELPGHIIRSAVKEGVFL